MLCTLQTRPDTWSSMEGGSPEGSLDHGSVLWFLSGGQHCFCALELGRALLTVTPTLQEENNARERIRAGDHSCPAETLQIHGWMGFTQEKIPVVSPQCLAGQKRGCSGDISTPAEVGCVLTARCWCGHECLWPCHLQGKTSPTEWEIPCTVLLSFCCPSLPPHPDCIPAA